MPNEIFISYAREDSEFVSSLVSELKIRGIDPWYDEDDIPKAVPWDDSMLLGVQRCRDFLFIISPDSIVSEPCALELREALRLNKRIIPGLIRPIEQIDFLHPVLRKLNWLRFDKDRFKAFRELIELINSPEGWMGQLVDRPSAVVEVHYFDNKCLTFPLIQDCYWVGRRPAPPHGTAGAIALPDPDPQNPITSRFHVELRVVNDFWYAINRGKNNIVLYPPCANGKLKDNTKIFVGHSYLIYKEVNCPAPLPEQLVDQDTIGDFNNNE
jgi:hypothetical protein